MPARSRARKRALDILFESEQQGLAPGATLSRWVSAGEPPVNEYTVTLVEGVIEYRDRIDELLTAYAEGWTLDRMPAVDRNVLRMGAYEILYRDDVPDPVAISEAVALVRELSTDESPGFVNGLLARVIEVKPSLSS
ncbi:transcription antitermination factor NusB [Phytoactinopolyspora mesophila]|uniref:Transcription antitermination protein NusB n=1 Tax=Phytoactinopolyspora mesophila TaxID=2650750 RepID=A0A7K3LZD4_9ACTN|nr:transcription antitermination factor NusB [Phytoactinopolyspora mesophila]NDL56391.1 transcription antitermination factor NusB [Phytoactinopolyspora mesophila]